MASRKCLSRFSFAAFFCALCFLLNRVHKASGQGTGPLGSIADYYDHAFGNPFLGYWKNPGNKNPYGSQQAPYGGYGNYAGVGSLLGGGLGVAGYGNGLGVGGAGLYGNGLAGFDRAPIASPSYAYDRIVPGAGDFNYPSSLLTYGGGTLPYASDALLGSSALGRSAVYGGTVAGLPMSAAGGAYAGLGYNYPIVDSRTPADRALQNLLVSTYAYKPWYP